MNLKNAKTRTTKRKVKKVRGICVTYSDLQYTAVDMLVKDPRILSITLNVPCDGFVLNGKEYTTDILAETESSYYAFECVFRSHLKNPKTMNLLALSCRLWDGTLLNNKPVTWEVFVDAE